ncbi:hypothetical protein [Hahella sp. NBU794]|uniref:hypothetical protein n=1 Tax=Hahella sp. NBU794 TaxID=3422590 RepID=UPI003D6ECFB4
MKLNKRMRALFDGLGEARINPPQTLDDIVAKRFVETNDGVLLAYFAKRRSNTSPGYFPDKTGFECFVNSFHIDDYVDKDFLAYSLFVVSSLKADIERYNLKTIVGIDDDGGTVRFHVDRVGEEWLSDDIEGYSEALLVLESTDINEIKKLS